LLKCIDVGAKVKVMEKNHGILSLHKKAIKNIIRKVLFIREPFITVSNNTNSYGYSYKGLLKYLDAGAKVKVMEKIHVVVTWKSPSIALTLPITSFSFWSDSCVESNNLVLIRIC